MASSKSLVAYFSRNGNNYVGGSIVNLPIGNTEIIAHKIRGLTHSEVFRITTERSYPEDYTEATEVAGEEKRKNARPRLVGKVDGINSYDVIYLGYPNWWGTMPMAVFSFLESYDLSGRTIAPYCTHEGSGMGNSESDIKRTCPKAKVLPGLAIRGGSVDRADKDVENWLRQLDSMK
jgi:flavodoxin